MVNTPLNSDHNFDSLLNLWKNSKEVATILAPLNISTVHHSFLAQKELVYFTFVSAYKLGEARARGVANIVKRSEPPRVVTWKKNEM